MRLSLNLQFILFETEIGGCRVEISRVTKFNSDVIYKTSVEGISWFQCASETFSSN